MARVLLISTYELGHQPIHVASPAGALRRRGHEVTSVDTSVEAWDPRAVDDIDLVALSVPMHTAMRLALDIARTIRTCRPGLPICLYGLYAGVASGHVLAGLADRLIAGEYETALCDWADGGCVDGGQVDGDRAAGGPAITHLARARRGLPARDLLPPLARYARLLIDGDRRPAAAVQTSHGCVSRCRHCPVPAVYGGRLRIVDTETVLADIDQVVALGAAHITFADPDFLNGPHHSLRIVRAMQRRHPTVTFDVTTKIEFILRHRHIWAEMAASGCLFVTTALECVDDRILALLDKGHTAADAAEAVAVLRQAGIEPRPSLLPFTPWTTLDGLADLITFAVDHDLVANIDPVHWSIRLLLPDGSLLLARDELVPYLDGYNPQRLGWQWHAADPEVDRLQRDLVALIEDGVVAGRDPLAVFEEVAARILGAVGRPFPLAHGPSPDRDVTDRRGTERGQGPRLSETWFCCAEPTCGQRARASLSDAASDS